MFNRAYGHLLTDLTQLQERVVGRKRTEPISRTYTFSLVSALYAGTLAYTQMYIATIAPLREGLPPGVERINWTAIVLVSVFTGTWLLAVTRFDRLYELGFPWVRPRYLVVSLGYFTIVLLAPNELSFAYLGATVVACVLIGAVVEVYNHPLLPISSPTTTDIDVLQLHLTNWWRKVRLIVALYVAVCIGIGFQFFSSNFSSFNVLVFSVVPIGIGVGAVVIHAFWKMDCIERELF